MVSVLFLFFFERAKLSATGCEERTQGCYQSRLSQDAACTTAVAAAAASSLNQHTKHTKRAAISHKNEHHTNLSTVLYTFIHV